MLDYRTDFHLVPDVTKIKRVSEALALSCLKCAQIHCLITGMRLLIWSTVLFLLTLVKP